MINVIILLPLLISLPSLSSLLQHNKCNETFSSPHYHQVMSATENLIVDCLASNPGSKDFTSYQHVIQLLSECFDHTDGDGDGNDDGDD